MFKTALISMFVTFVSSNEVLRYEPQNSVWTQKPAFCNKLDCPEFTVVTSTKEYEVRDYVDTDWVSTNQLNLEYRKASSTNFMKLFKYIGGQNDKQQKVAMTCPVLTRIIPGQGPACESNFTMSFFVAPDQKPAPKPTNPEVFLNSVSKFRAYVRQFGGFAMDYPTWRDEALKLGEALTKDGLEFVTETWWTAGYDALQTVKQAQ